MKNKKTEHLRNVQINPEFDLIEFDAISHQARISHSRAYKVAISDFVNRYKEMIGNVDSEMSVLKIID